MRRFLSEGTQTAHGRVEQAMARLNLADRLGYRAFLLIHRRALHALSRRWNRQDQPDFTDMLSCLTADLQRLGSFPETGMVIREPVAEPLCQWGIGYVVRGSRLGAKLLRLRVPDGYPTAYLDYAPILTWQVFLTELDLKAHGLTSAARGEVLHGAKVAFRVFSVSATMERAANG
jgi:heme oxygenase